MKILGKFLCETKYKCKNHVGKTDKITSEREEAFLIYILHCIE